jgi:hypothetical protein
MWHKYLFTQEQNRKERHNGNVTSHETCGSAIADNIKKQTGDDSATNGKTREIQIKHPSP